MESLTRLLLEFSGLLERDYCRARRDEHGHGHGQNGIHGDGGVGGSGGGGGGAGPGAGTAGRRIENMGVLLEQLAPLLDWESEVGRKASVDGRTALRFCSCGYWRVLAGFAGTGQSYLQDGTKRLSTRCTTTSVRCFRYTPAQDLRVLLFTNPPRPLSAVRHVFNSYLTLPCPT